MTFRCLIVDDSEAFLDAAKRLLEAGGIAVVGVATTGQEALRLASERAPDLALVDVQLRGESGIDVARRLAQLARPPKTILTSTRAEDDLVELIERAPAEGFIPKNRLSSASIRELLGL